MMVTIVVAQEGYEQLLPNEAVGIVTAQPGCPVLVVHPDCEVYAKLRDTRAKLSILSEISAGDFTEFLLETNLPGGD